MARLLLQLLLLWAICVLALPSPARAAGEESQLATGAAETPHGFAKVYTSSDADFVVGMKADGTVWSWGANWGGQLGDGTTVDKSTPVQIPSLTGARQIAIGSSHGMAIKGDGTVWTWGDNSFGQLGDGTTTEQHAPIQIASLTGARQLAAGSSSSMVILANGTVWSWGDNQYGKLGDGTNVERDSPVQIAGLTGARSIRLGSFHGMAVKADGTVWAWGANWSGQLGDGTEVTTYTPIQVASINGARMVVAGAYSSAVIKADGTVWLWGENPSGQLGDGTTVYKNAPVQVASLTGTRQLSLGNSSTMAIKADGSVWAWGSNTYGQLGNGNTTSTSTPIAVGVFDGARQVAVGVNFTLVVKADGTTWSAGRNYSGQLGDGTMVAKYPHVQTLFGCGCGFVTVSAGGEHVLGIKADGTVWAWGRNDHGQVGDGTFVDKTSPVQIPGLTGARQVSAGSNHSMAVKADGTVWTWGWNSSGQLGDGTTVDKNTPVQIASLTGARQLASGAGHSMAILGNGTVWAWGSNSFGQIGNGATGGTVNAPAQIASLTGARQLALGGSHSMAIKSDGTVWTWGFNGNGRLGDGTTVDKNAPVQIASLTGARYVDAGGAHSMAIKADGTVWSWGYNADGRVGDGTLIARTAPVQIAGLTGTRQLSADSAHSVAIKADGTVWSWGGNTNGRLGDGTIVDKSAPVQIASLTGARLAEAGGNHSLAIKGDGTVSAWGSNASGQLGDGTTVQRTSPSTGPYGCPDVTAPTPNASTGSGLATSTTQVTWTITAAVDDPGGSGLAALPYSFDNGGTWQASNVLAQTGLSANTQYSKTIRVRDAAGNLTTAATISRYTLPGVPTAGSATGGWNSTDGYNVVLGWTAPASGASSYRVRWSVDAYAGVQGSPAGTSFTKPSLAANTGYNFKVCAVNADGAIEATCSGVFGATTPPAAPTAPTTTNVTDTSVDVSWTSAAGATSAKLDVYSDAGCTALVSSVAAISSPYTRSGLSRDRSYWYRLSSYSATSATWGAPTACVALSGNGRTGLTISADSGTVALGTILAGGTGTGSTTLTTQSYGATGYTIAASGALLTSGGNTIPGTTSGTVGSPPGASAGVWAGTGFGFTVASATNLEAGWGGGTKWARFNTSPEIVHATGAAFTANTANSTATVVNYKLVVPAAQPVGAYATTITYTAVGTP